MCRHSSRYSSWGASPTRDKAQRAVTQLLGWVVSSQCLAEIRPPQHPPFIPGFLFAFVLTHKTKTAPGTAAARRV